MSTYAKSDERHLRHRIQYELSQVKQRRCFTRCYPNNTCHQIFKDGDLMGSLDRRVRKTSTEATDAELPANCLNGIFVAHLRIPHLSIKTILRILESEIIFKFPVTVYVRRVDKDILNLYTLKT